MELFVKLHNGELPFYMLNFGGITLFPKKEGATRIEQFRPICFLNLSFKVTIKVGTNRATMDAHKVVKPT
jgi:hypothetical protein